jgi:hypothetical protein
MLMLSYYHSVMHLLLYLPFTCAEVMRLYAKELKFACSVPLKHYGIILNII